MNMWWLQFSGNHNKIWLTKTRNAHVVVFKSPSLKACRNTHMYTTVSRKQPALMCQSKEKVQDSPRSECTRYIAHLDLVALPVLSGECEGGHHFNPSFYAPAQKFPQLLASVRMPLTRHKQGHSCRLRKRFFKQNSPIELRKTYNYRIIQGWYPKSQGTQVNLGNLGPAFSGWNEISQLLQWGEKYYGENEETNVRKAKADPNTDKKNEIWQRWIKSDGAWRSQVTTSSLYRAV